jgi:hypothetical protein
MMALNLYLLYEISRPKWSETHRLYALAALFSFQGAKSTTARERVHRPHGAGVARDTTAIISPPIWRVKERPQRGFRPPKAAVTECWNHPSWKRVAERQPSVAGGHAELTCDLRRMRAF